VGVVHPAYHGGELGGRDQIPQKSIILGRVGVEEPAVAAGELEDVDALLGGLEAGEVGEDLVAELRLEVLRVCMPVYARGGWGSQVTLG
jgi:hypothetical protein